MREDLERSARVVREGPVFPYPHLKATLISSVSLLDMAGASKDEVGEDAHRNLDQCPLRGDQECFALLVLAAERPRRQSCDRLCEDQERQAYLVPAGEKPRWQKSGCLRRGQGRYAYVVPAVKNR